MLTFDSIQNKIKAHQMIDGLSSIASGYDGFIIDLWGVIHDGRQLFEGVIPCLQELKALGKCVVFLSSAPRSSAIVVEQLTSFGLPRDLYDGVLTSGDLTLHYLRLFDGDNYYHLGCPERDATLLMGIGMNHTPYMWEADIIVASNFQESRPLLEDYLEEFDRAIAAEVPMVCANPDLLVCHGESKRLCAGALAEEYLRRGGSVQFFGKPYVSTYEHLMSKHGGKNWLAIGDALATDIKGANAVGLDSLLVLSGIHKEDQSIIYDKITPTYIDQKFYWF